MEIGIHLRVETSRRFLYESRKLQLQLDDPLKF